MNIFYAPPGQIHDTVIDLTGQEASHASNALRYKAGDDITVTDGRGGWYEGIVRQITGKSVRIEVVRVRQIISPGPKLVLGLSIIKKRDRLEFAVEKAVELGAGAIVLFRSDHSVKKNVRLGRLESVVLSAMKQSMQAWLPEISVCDSASDVIDKHPGHEILVAHEKKEGATGISDEWKNRNQILLLVGPEGGFSEREINVVKEKGATLVSLGSNRLRTETAAVALMSQFI